MTIIVKQLYTIQAMVFTIQPNQTTVQAYNHINNVILSVHTLN
jgi:hypothetical protein